MGDMRARASDLLAVLQGETPKDKELQLVHVASEEDGQDWLAVFYDRRTDEFVGAGYGEEWGDIEWTDGVSARELCSLTCEHAYDITRNIRFVHAHIEGCPDAGGDPWVTLHPVEQVTVTLKVWQEKERQ